MQVLKEQHCVFVANNIVACLPVATDGDIHGRVPALPPEHLWSHLVPAVDLGGGHGWGAAGPLYCLLMLLLCECLSPWLQVCTLARERRSTSKWAACLLVSPLQTLLTAISMSAIATNGVVPGKTFPPQLSFFSLPYYIDQAEPVEDK